MTSADELGDTLPARSVDLAVSVWSPSASVLDVMLQLPPASATAVPRTVLPSESYNVTRVPASACPLMVGVVSLVMSSLEEDPVSEAESRSSPVGAVGAAVSTVTPNSVLVDETFPAESAAVAVKP